MKKKIQEQLQAPHTTTATTTTTTLTTTQTPTMKNWSFISPRLMQPDAHHSLRGQILHHPKFEDGQNLITDEVSFISVIQTDVDTKQRYRVVSTSTQEYLIFEDDIHPEYNRVYKRAFERLSELISFN